MTNELLTPHAAMLAVMSSAGLDTNFDTHATATELFCQAFGMMKLDEKHVPEVVGGLDEIGAGLSEAGIYYEDMCGYIQTAIEAIKRNSAKATEAETTTSPEHDSEAGADALVGLGGRATIREQIDPAIAAARRGGTRDYGV